MVPRLQSTHSLPYIPSLPRASYSSATITHSQKRKAPPYPYGAAQHFKQRDTGLYGGSKVQHGNKVSEKHEVKTLRAWHPNVQNKRLWSDALGRFVRLKVQARVLRTIDKVGGLDEYLLGDKSARIKELGLTGWHLRWQIMQTERVKERFRTEKVRLGLPSAGYISQQEKSKKVLRQRATELALMYVRAEQEQSEKKQNSEAKNNLTEDDQPSLPSSLVLEANVDTIAMEIAEDTRSVSRTLPLPQLEPDMLEEISTSSKDFGISLQPTHKDFHSTLVKLKDIAAQLNTPLEDLISQAHTANRAIEERKPRKPERKDETTGAQEIHPLIPPAEPHFEIDSAIERGTAWQLFSSYRPYAQHELMKLRKEREAQRVTIANRYIWLMRTSRRKGGAPGVYVKKSAWDTAYKKAGKEVLPKSNVFNVPRQRSRKGHGRG
ncbi:uncharacterized protein KY384_004263 [Bacidia gigantensis]|uniref:uncharacterized protein n=1 Tax=Bacidia gigantensis TaxID=2732470 RepID=UPI001D051724|nr:uncharacterized protein KY384_004263 [Bacidia gigantensis]KAG8530906.1 hypothetical protein KY384_004263 [Bacidia gigantensis]